MPNVFNVNSVRSRRYTWQRTATVYLILFRLPLSHLVAKYHPRRDPTLFYAHDSPSLRIEVQLLPRVLLPGRQFVADGKIKEHVVTVPIEHIGAPLYKRPFDLCVIFSAPIQGAPQPWNYFWVAPILEIIRYFAVLAEKGLETFGRVGVHAHSPYPLPIKSYVCEPVPPKKAGPSPSTTRSVRSFGLLPVLYLHWQLSKHRNPLSCVRMFSMQHWILEGRSTYGANFSTRGWRLGTLPLLCLPP